MKFTDSELKSICNIADAFAKDAPPSVITKYGPVRFSGRLETMPVDMLIQKAKRMPERPVYVNAVIKESPNQIESAWMQFEYDGDDLYGISYKIKSYAKGDKYWDESSVEEGEKWDISDKELRDIINGFKRY